MSINVGRGMLLDAAKQLRARWSVVRRDWDDANSREFERRYLQPLEPRIRETVEAMERLSQLSAAARRECE